MRVKGSQRARQLLLAAALLTGAAASYGDDTNTLLVRIDNDLFTGTDRDYTSGVQVGMTSAAVERFDDAELAPSLRWANEKLKWLQPKGFEENNVAWTIGQRMFTPEDWSRTEPDPNDRPYAGLLFAGLTYNGRSSHTLRSTTIEVGIVGPSALAEQTQRMVHRAVGADRFLGWDHQLNDEPVFRVLHQRFQRWDVEPARKFADVTVHYGGSIGNLITFANAGAEVRFGKTLPDNFGTATTLAYGQDTAPMRWSAAPSGLSIHGFVAVDARAVLHDITLDGNTWRDSASVEREPLVGEVTIGVALRWREWMATLGKVFRTKEYATQDRDASFGTLTFRRALAES